MKSKLGKLYDRTINDEKFLLEKISTNEKLFIGSLTDVNKFLAFYSMFVENDFKKAKQYFYNAALISLYSIRKYNAPFYTNIYSICYALLSDNEFIINKFSKLEKENNTQIMGRLFIKNIQNVLNNINDISEIENLSNLLSKKPQGFNGLDIFFAGLKNGDKEKIKTTIKQLISNHGKRGELELYKDYFSFEITCLMKLAWRQGIEVEVNSPLVPKEILPIEPLDIYKIPYDFLKDEII